MKQPAILPGAWTLRKEGGPEAQGKKWGKEIECVTSRVALPYLTMGPTQAVERDRLDPVGHGSHSHTAILLLCSHVSAFSSPGLTVLIPLTPRLTLPPDSPMGNPQRDCGSSLGTESLVWPGSRAQSGRAPTHSPGSCQRPPGTSTREKIYSQARRSVRKDTYTVVLTAEFTSSSFICY